MKRIRKNKIKAWIALFVALMLVFPMAATPISVSADSYASNFAGGSGTEKDPYLISTKEQFGKLRTFQSGAYYKLTNDIYFDISDFEEGGMFYNEGMGWLPIETPFSGTLDGNGYGVYGLMTAVLYSGGSAEAGVFARNMGKIVNLTVGSNVYIDNFTEGTDYYTAVGSICGINDSQGIIANCTSTSFVTSCGDNITSVGGIAGVNYGLIQNSTNAGYVEVWTYNYIGTAGGIAGINYGKIINCANKDMVDGYGFYSGSQLILGGIAGMTYESGSVEYSYNVGDVCSNYSGEEKNEGMSTCGGIAGYALGNVLYCYNKGRVIGTSHVDGCVTGGIAGITSKQISGCYNEGLVTNNVTSAQALISGGIAGVLQSGTIINSYNCKDVGGAYYVGGIAGAVAIGEISGCYNVGLLSPINNGSEKFVGWLVGENENGIVSYNYFCTDLPTEFTDINPIGKGGTGSGSNYPLTMAQMKDLNSFTYFNKAIWTINAGGEYPYPTLISTEKAKVVKGISVTKMPDKTQYDLNESFSIAGMVVSVNYEDGTSAPVTGYVWSTLDSSTPGDKTIKISYNYFTTEITVTVAHAEPTGIEVTTLPGRLNYPLGTAFSEAGIVVSVKYDNNQTEQITGYTITGFDPNKLGNQTLTVSYKGFTATFDVSVFDPENVSVIKGDTDFDLDVDSDDAIYLLYHVLFGEEGYKLNQECNFDGLGVLDSDDAIYLLYHVLFGSEGYPLK